MLVLDHLAFVAPSLAEGVDHVRACLDLDISYGGAHPEMGTHNHLLRLGDSTFLEVIATDPHADRLAAPRWFGLSDADAVRSAWEDGRRLRGWVARTSDLDSVLAHHGDLLGKKMRVSRGDRSWFFAVRNDGSLPADGLAPSVIEWGDQGCPAPEMPDLGARLISFAVEHPDPIHVSSMYERLGVQNPPEVMPGAQFRYRATIATPSGTKNIW